MKISLGVRIYIYIYKHTCMMPARGPQTDLANQVQASLDSRGCRQPAILNDMQSIGGWALVPRPAATNNPEL